MSRSTRIAAIVILALALAISALGLTGCRVSKDGAATGSPAQSGVGTASAGDTAGTTSPAQPAPPTIPVAGKVLPPPSGAYLGVYVPPAPFDLGKIDNYESQAGKKVSIVMWYQPWAAHNRSLFDTAACVAVMRRGKVPMITWEPWDPGGNANNVKNPGVQPAFSLRAINSGKYDAYLRQWADEIRALGGPVMLRPMHEMNGNWYPWSGTTNGNTPTEYVAAWRRMHDIFVQEGATNVTWVWSINHESVPGTAANRYAAYYPGDAYVDWTAISGFNWGTSSPFSTWRSYLHWYTRPVAYLKTLKKPICIAEFASVEQGGDKAAWIADAYKHIKATPKIKAVVYFDSREQGTSTSPQDWRINTSAASLAGFRKAISSDYFVGGPPAALTDWANQLSDQDWQYLSSIQPIY